MIEKIDQPEKKDSFSELIASIQKYLKSYDDIDIKERLKIEKQVDLYAQRNSPSWLLNLIIVLFKEDNEL